MPVQAPPALSHIEVVQARTHNLKAVNVSIPRQKLTVVTGVSGSGKSSLAFHTIFAEGQRRFLGTLSEQSRELLNQLPLPDVDQVSGLPPVISVPQQTRSPGSRSTVATLTEIMDYLRLLFARLGVVHCPDCQIPVRSQTPEQIVQKILQWPERTKLMLMAPILRDEKKTHQEVFDQITKEGFVRARVDGEIVEVSEAPPLDASKRHTIDVVVDRLIIKDDMQQRLADSVEQTLRTGKGMCLAVVQKEGEWVNYFYHRDLCCPGCDQSFPTLEPRTFSWHSPAGACPQCEGSGVENAVPDAVCLMCSGTRLNPLAANVQVNGQTLPVMLDNTLEAARQWLTELPARITEETEELIARKLCEPILSRFDFLEAVGVGYLSLNRSAVTLSGGELQRVKLARCLGTQLQGSCYILDEPTAGLHREDTSRLIEVMQKLVQQGNTVICVEHNLDLVQAANHIVELGPGGGKLGGELLFAGPREELQQAESVPTSQALQESQTARSAASPANEPTDWVTLKNSNLHNLQEVSIQIPLGELTCVSGVSGSGKSSLLLDALVPLWKTAIHQETQTLSAETLGKFSCTAQVSQLQFVDQSPPGQHARSCPATYSGIWEEIRRLMSLTKLAKLRGFTPRRFSFNSTAGTCEKCQGRGEIRVKLDYLPQSIITCPTCHGKRFNAQTLAIRYRGHSIADLLEMTIAEAMEFWSEMSRITQLLQPFQEIGLGYLKLGQPANSLSGGESQRMKLARQMSQQLTNSVLVLDEPTSGLHWQDVSRLLDALEAIRAQQNTIIVVEHHPLVEARASWHIQMGPGAGPEGGQVLYCGRH